MSDRYAVIGNPVAHSQSPTIHAAFAAQTGEDIVYDKLPAPRDGFAATVMQFFAEGGKGSNVTLPFKGEAYQCVDQRSERACSAGAVNTISLLADGRLAGDNTDGTGLIRDLTVNLGLTLADRRILLLGAGGAAQGVLHPLLALQPRRLAIANRTAEKAARMAQSSGDTGAVVGIGFDQVAAHAPFDLIINATAAGLAGDTPPLPATALADGALAYDMLYADQPTPFMCWAQAHGAARAVDGYGMLVEQAAESFRIWRGVRPDTASLLRERGK